MRPWGIVAGDYGASYKATAEGVDLHLCTATIKVWRNSTLLVDEEDCTEVQYDSDEDESYCYYTVASGDFPSSAAIGGKRTIYKVMIEFTKDGYKEHDLGFEWLVVPGPPSS